MTQRRLMYLGLALATTMGIVATADSQPDENAPCTVTTVYIVRHAEKTTGEHPQRDNPLTTKGHARARALSELLRSVELSTIYTTKWIRCLDTAAPIAALQDIVPTVYRAMNAADDVVPEVLSRRPGTNVLIIGHSNTVTSIARAFGAVADFELTDSDYDDLFVVTLVHHPDRSFNSFLQRLHFEPWE